jgi:HSP20 family protein
MFPSTHEEHVMASRFLAPSSARSWLPEPMYQLQREIDRVFDDVFSGSAGAGRSASALMSAPRIDLQDADNELRLHADLPGVAPADLDVRVDGDVLTIRGERKSESDRNEQNFHVMERSHGRFQRSIQLPFAPDPNEIQAHVREGVLEIKIPKHAPQERSRRIEVRDGNANRQALSAQGAGGADGNSGGADRSSGGAEKTSGAAGGGVAGAVGGSTATPTTSKETSTSR